MNYLSQYFSSKAITAYGILIILISLIAFQYVLPVLWMAIATLTVLYFFKKGANYTFLWRKLERSNFRSRLFVMALLFREIWVLSSYLLYTAMTGQPFEFSAADSIGYHNEATWMVEVLAERQFDVFWEYYSNRLSDMGYPVYLTLVYSVFGDSVLIVRLLKIVLGAITVVLIYKLATRNFNEQTGRVAGIIALLYPNLIYYTGLHTKETEMVFLLVLFVERADYLLHRKNFSYFSLVIVIIIGISVYFFRAVLAYCAFLSFVLVLLLAKRKLLKARKKLLFVFTLLVVGLVISGNQIINEAIKYWDTRTSNQEVSIEQRTKTNKLARYGSAVIFAPLILITPLPTFVNIEEQQNHMLLSGANFVKNIMAFFVLIALFALLKKQVWRKHVLILAILAIYLAILSMSKFALVERFHMPALPFHIILAAYGISNLNKKNVKYFRLYLVFIAILIVGWNWFKLAGRGLI